MNSEYPALSNAALTVTCLGLLLGTLLFGLWPFWYTPANHAEIVDSEGAIRFQRSDDEAKLNAGGLAFTPRPLIFSNSQNSSGGSLTLEIAARPSPQFKLGLGLLAALCDQDGTIKLLLAQWKTHLVIRTFFFPSKRGNYTEIGLKDALVHGETSFITITSDDSQTVLYVNGKMSREVAGIRLLPESMDLAGYRLYFGNDLGLAHPWSGELFDFALYDRALSATEASASFRKWSGDTFSSSTDANPAMVRYSFDAAAPHEEGTTVRDAADGLNPLLLPATIPFKKPLLDYSPLRSNGVMDITINLLGFIPFGFFLSWWFKQVRQQTLFWSCAAAVLCGFSVSLFIEVCQAHMPTRSSSLNDLLCNTLGTILGAMLLHYAMVQGRCLIKPALTAQMAPARASSKTS